MSKNQLRRKRENRTDYHKRFRYLKSRKPRVVVRMFSNTIVVQLVEYSPDGDKVLTGFNSSHLKDLGWKYSCSNMPAAYLTGFLLGCKSQGIEAIADIGPHAAIKGSKVFAVIKGAIDGGLKIPFKEEMAPDESRLNGEHIKSFVGLSKDKTQFSKYPKTVNIDKDVNAIKEKMRK